MALKINGTEVISDARYLTNITGFDAQTEAIILDALKGIPDNTTTFNSFRLQDSSGSYIDGGAFYGANTA